MKKTSISVGMVGFGTVGAGVAKILLNNAHLIRRRDVFQDLLRNQIEL